VGEQCESCRFSSELCRYLTWAECQEIEDAFLRKATKTRTISLAAESNGTNVEIRTLIILVVWKNHVANRELITRDQIDRLWNGLGTDEWIPTGSIANYTKSMSYGKVSLHADVVDWQVTDNTEEYYADGRSGFPMSDDYDPALRSAFHFILDKMEAEDFPWNSYNSDNDEYIDHIQFLHSGYGAEYGGVDCQTNAPTEDRIWSHAMPEGRGQWKSEKTGLELGTFSTASVFHGICGTDIAHLGVMMHEFYHTLGLPDLYDLDKPYTGRPGFGGLVSSV
jgi:M6 family metalloprotease-like protein